MQIINEWMLRDYYDLAAVVSAIFTLSYTAIVVRGLLL